MLWTAAKVRADLVEAVRLSWRLPSASASPSSFATDGPWNLISRVDRAGSWIEAWRQEQDEVRERRGRGLAPVPLRSDEVDWVYGRLEWITLIGADDRKLVRLAIGQLAETGNRVDWTAIRAQMPREVANKGLYRRFMRALQALAEALNARGEKRLAA